MERIEALLDQLAHAARGPDREAESAARAAILEEIAEGSARRAGLVIARGIQIGRAQLQRELRTLLGTQYLVDEAPTPTPEDPADG